MRELSVIDFIIFGTAFFSGILAHEGAHLLVCHALKLNPKFDLIKLSVLCNQPANKTDMRLIGLAPIVLFILVGCFEIIHQVTTESTFLVQTLTYPAWTPIFITQHFRLTTLLFMVGLIIGVSPSDLSPTIASSGGSWQRWKNTPQSLKIALGGALLAALTLYLKNIPVELLPYGKDAVFLQVIIGLFEVCIVAVLLIAVGIAILQSKPKSPLETDNKQ